MANWNEVPCPACKKPVSVDATKCPYCQTEYTEQQRKERVSNLKGGLVGCGVIVLLLALLVAFCSPGDDEFGGDPSEEAVASRADDIVALYLELQSIVRPCDRAAAAVSMAVETGDMVTAYRAAEQAEEECLPVSRKIGELAPPIGLRGEQLDSVREALESCDAAYLSRWSAMKGLRQAIDGDMSPSKMAEIESATEAHQALSLVCVGTLIGVAKGLGVTDERLGLAD